MRNFLVVLMLICGCDALRPQYQPDIDDSWIDQQQDEVRVVLVSEPWCDACKEQRLILQELADEGSIAGFDEVNTKHPTYKARVLPTLYVCCDHGCKKIEGLSSKQEVLRAAQE